MELKIIDNFLDENDFNTLINNTIGQKEGNQSEFRIVTDVGNLGVHSENYWSWYMVHMIYCHDMPQNQIYPNICNIFIPRFLQVANFKTMIRIKINAYPYTNVVKEHEKHIDFNYEHTGAVFSLNTCDGYTKFSDGNKVESVANRIVFFDASKVHQSSTTSNAKLRYNINFNFL